jgi:hypothetical protein
MCAEWRSGRLEGIAFCFEYGNLSLTLSLNERLDKPKPKCGNPGQGSGDGQLGILSSSGGDSLKLNSELSVDIHLVIEEKLFGSTGSDLTSWLSS